MEGGWGEEKRYGQDHKDVTEAAQKLVRGKILELMRAGKTYRHPDQPDGHSSAVSNLRVQPKL